MVCSVISSAVGGLVRKATKFELMEFMLTSEQSR